MLVNRDLNLSPFSEIDTRELNLPIPNFIEIDGRSALIVTGLKESPFFDGEFSGTIFSGSIDLYPQLEGGKYLTTKVQESPLRNIATESRITDFTVADFNNDGKDDLINSFNLSELNGKLIGDGLVEYYQLNEGGVYQAVESELFSEINRDADSKLQTTLDVNGDSLLDLVFTTDNSEISTIYLNNGETFELFTEEVNLPSEIDINQPLSLYSVDADNDGDADLVKQESDNSLTFFRYQDGQYTIVAAAENPFAGFNAPGQLAFNDVDRDTDIDVLAITNNGDVSYYENVSIVNNNPPIAASDLFEVFNSSPQEINVLRNDLGAQSQALTISDFDSVSALGGAITLENNLLFYTAPPGITVSTDDTFEYTVTDATGQSDTATVTLRVFPQLFIQREGENNPFTDLTIANEPVPDFADIDGDGDVDLLLGNKGSTVAYFRNDEGNFIKQTGSDNPFEGIDIGGVVDSTSWAFADYDSDGDLDMVGASDLVYEYQEYFYFRNDDGVYVELFGDDLPVKIATEIDLGANLNPTAVDWDDDGDEDLVVGSGSRLLYFRNDDGTLQEVAETDNPFQDFNAAEEDAELDLGGGVSPNFFDFDNDRDLDLIVGNGLGYVLAFRNNGDSWTRLLGQDHPFGENFETGEFDATVGKGDVDGDGDEDAVIGSEYGDLFYWESQLANMETIPETPNPNPNPDSLLDTSINRFQNENIPGTYLFAGESETENIRENFPNFTEEGLAFKVAVEPGDDLIPLYRFQSKTTSGTYLFAGESERENINQDFSEEFTEEGLAFYVYGAGSGKGSIFYRFQNEDKPGTYLFAGESESASIRENFSNFTEEGAAFEVGI